MTEENESVVNEDGSVRVNTDAQSSVEFSRTASGKYTWTVKVYNPDPGIAMNRAKGYCRMAEDEVERLHRAREAMPR